MTCENCKHSRKLVNRKKPDRVGCMYATDFEHHEEKLISKGVDVSYEMIYPNNDTLRMMGVTVSAGGTCPMENLGGRSKFYAHSGIFEDLSEQG